MEKTTGFAVVLAVLACVTPAAAQIPDEFTNLQVLPKDIGKRELVEIMRQFSTALGTRCNHCHVGEPGGSLRGMDFATDELEHKKVARSMMEMTRQINSKLLPATGRTSLTRVRCATCHRGVEEPELLDSILARAAERGGVDEAIARYSELREEYYGRGAYDFGARTLNGVAEKLARDRDDLDGAIALMRVNVEHHPDAAHSHLLLGQLLAEHGDQAGAIVSLERAIELEPDNRWAKQALEQVKAAE